MLNPLLDIQDATAFIKYCDDIAADLGDTQIEYSQTKDPLKKITVKALIEQIHTIARVLFQNSAVIIPKHELEILAQATRNLAKLVILKVKTPKARQQSAYFCLLQCIAAQRLIYHYFCELNIQLSLENKVEIDAIFESFNTNYELVDLYFNDDVEQDVYLKKLKKQVFDNLGAMHRIGGTEQISREEILFHLKQKTEKSREFDGRFNGQLIDNPQSTRITQIDKVTMQALLQAILNMKAEGAVRTQFMIRVHGAIGHMIGLDVNYNKASQCFEIICLESATQKVQWSLLENLTQQLAKHGERYKIIAIQAALQKAMNGCVIFTLVLMGESSKLNFDTLIARSNQQTSFNPCTITFYDRYQDDRTLKELPALKNVIWAPVTVLGINALKMAQSTTTIKEVLSAMKLKPQEIEQKLRRWQTSYEWEKENQVTSYQYVRKALKLRFKGTPFADLSLEHVLTKLKESPEEVVTLGLGVRRLAAGLGPKRELAFLIDTLEKEGKLELLNEPGGQSKKTALHWALSIRSMGRTCLLLSKRAGINHPDKDGNTEKVLYESITDPRFKNNQYLKQKFK